MSRSTRLALLGAGAAALTLAGALPASAHVSAVPNTATTGSTAVVAFRVPHGCDGQDTYELEMSIPESITAVKPKLMPGWIIRIDKVKRDKPLVSGTTTLTDRVAKVTWSGNMPDDFFEDFTLRVGLPDAPNTTLNFPVIQRCIGTKPVNWTEIAQPGQPEPEHPAPSLKITPKA